MEGADTAEETPNDKTDANTCMALGVGVGALGATAAALSGAICPLCIFIAPALVGYGAYRRWMISDSKENGKGLVKEGETYGT